MPQALSWFVCIVLFTGLIPALCWTLLEPLWARNPPAWHPRITLGETLERMLKHWNTETAIRYTTRNDESLSNKNYHDYNYKMYNFVCVLFVLFALCIFCDNMQYFKSPICVKHLFFKSTTFEFWCNYVKKIIKY